MPGESDAAIGDHICGRPVMLLIRYGKGDRHTRIDQRSGSSPLTGIPEGPDEVVVDLTPCGRDDQASVLLDELVAGQRLDPEPRTVSGHLDFTWHRADLVA